MLKGIATVTPSHLCLQDIAGYRVIPPNGPYRTDMSLLIAAGGEHRRVSPSNPGLCKVLRYMGYRSYTCANRGCQESPRQPNQRKGQNEKFMNFAHFCEFWENKHDSH